MARRRRIVKILVGIVIGVLLSKITLKKTVDLCLDDRQQKSKTFFSDGQQKAAVDNGPSEGLLFVGVMTASKYLETRAKAVYETWGRDVPGKITFFSSERSRSNSVPLIPLNGVDDSYPPQKKSFAMLKYMHDHYADKFEWFLRADDDVYVKTGQLAELLRSIDSNKPWFIGQTGKGNNEEFGLLSLEHDENFCMGGPGVILSKETLKRIAPYIEECLLHLYTTHEDVELGRCVRKFAGVSCTWSYEMQVIFYHNQSGEYAFTGDLKQKEVHRAITLHPIKQPQNMYRLHKYIQGLTVQNHKQDSINLHRDIVMAMSKISVPIQSVEKAALVEGLKLFEAALESDDYLGNPAVLGVPVSLTKYKSKDLADVLEWELISKWLYSYKDLNPRKRLGSSLHEGLNDIIREIMELINSYSKQRGRIIDFKDIFYGYWRMNPMYGVDLLLDLLLVYRKYRGRKMTVPVRRHAYIQQSFTGIEIREIVARDEERELPPHRKLIKTLFSKLSDSMPKISFLHDEETKPINFIVPLSGRHETFKRFLQIYEKTCLQRDKYTRLVIVLYKSNDGYFHKNKQLIEALKAAYGNDKVSYVTLSGQFSRAKALESGVQLLKDNDLMFFLDVDILFSKNTLQRIRFNTVQRKRAYFPIVFSLYDYTLFNRSLVNFEQFPSEAIINENSGFWRQFGFGIASIYKSDYETIGGLNTSITGWGMEDVHFYDKIIKSRIKIVRSVDPDLIHVYHPVICDNNLDTTQKNMCLGTKASTLASLYDLQQYYLQNMHLFR